ncbi:MAG: DUF2064 domain-containing protein [Acidobacteria bacterium]|nr:DUF2064 domain-containing protein [Acidobacteriota bacterium]
MYATVAPPEQRLLVFAPIPSPDDDRARTLLDALSGRNAESARNGIEIEVLWAPDAEANGDVLRRAFGQHSLAMQTGDTAGDRLAMAFSERFFFHRTRKIIAIGASDAGLSRELIDQAFALLDSCEWVVGPASDGDCYLIGCRAAAFDPGIFADLGWGAEKILAKALQRIREFGNTVATLPIRAGAVA